MFATIETRKPFFLSQNYLDNFITPLLQNRLSADPHSSSLLHSNGGGGKRHLNSEESKCITTDINEGRVQ
jgi:hypothetical protein